MTKRRMTTLMATALLGAVAVVTAATTVRAQNSDRVTKAPDFSLKNLDGKATTLADYKDKVVILDFWATWCPPCRAEIPHFKELQEKYGARGLQVVGIALDSNGATAVKPFADANKINYPLLIGNEQVVLAYGGVRSIPTTFIIDKKGQIVRQFVGYQSKEVFEKEIEPLLR